MAEFETPSFLQNKSVDDIFQTMAAAMPEDIDMSQGSHAYNLTYPTALVLAQMNEFILPEVIKLIFPGFSYGEYLDYHAQSRGMSRREATAATGEITITGAAGSIIPEGSVFSTAAINDIPSVDYQTTEEVTIPQTGSVTATIVCAQTGIIGNTGPNTVIIAASKITGITAVTNPAEISGGTAEEDDESLITRIQEYDQSQGNAFIGNASDYRRWAMSVDGVGNASVTSATDDSGLVTIVITDSNGEPANESLCTQVYNYIMSPNDPYARLAPINALLQVIAPNLLQVYVSATVEIDTGATTIENVIQAFTAAAEAYMVQAVTEQEIKYTKMAALLASTAGVNDFANFTIGTGSGTMGTVNIPLTSDQTPIVKATGVTFTEGTV